MAHVTTRVAQRLGKHQHLSPGGVPVYLFICSFLPHFVQPFPLPETPTALTGGPI